MPNVARKDGVDTVDTNHDCDANTVTETGSSNVFVNNIGVVRRSDLNREHDYGVTTTILVEDPPPEEPPEDYEPTFSEVEVTSCEPHQKALTTYSPNVFANNLNIGRLGDSYDDETLTSGSPNVFAN